MSTSTAWRESLPAVVRPYTQRAPVASLFLGISSGVPYAMIAATLTSRLAQEGIERRTVTTFALVFLVYNLKWLWAWMIDGVRLPLLGKLGQRVSWLIFAGGLAIAAIINLGLVDPKESLLATAQAAVFVAIAGATYDIVIDAYRIEWLEPEELGVGAGMYQYGWRIGSVTAAGLALFLANRAGWDVGYVACAFIALPAVAVALLLREPPRRQAPVERKAVAALVQSVVGPLSEFLRRKGAFLVLLFVLLHKMGDTLATLTFRLLFNDQGYSNDEIALYDVAFGFWAFLIGIFLGGILYSKVGMKRSVLISLVLMAVSNASFAVLAYVGKTNWGMAAGICFENIASGIGGVTVIAYFSALCDLRYTAAQYALISALMSVVGRILTGTTAGWLIDEVGYVNFYLFTTAIAFPGIVLFWFMLRAGLVDSSIGSAATQSAKRSS